MRDEGAALALNRVAAGLVPWLSGGPVPGDLRVAQLAEPDLRLHPEAEPFGSVQRHRGHHHVLLVGQARQHLPRVLRILRLAEDLLAQHHRGVRRQHQIRLAALRHLRRLVLGDAHHVVLRALAGHHRLVDVRRVHLEREPHPLEELAPQFAALADASLSGGIVNWTKGGELLTLAVKVGAAPEGRVITFEDITRQILDQRQAAWSDVARRIAHEIKNPLTPIQLATERLKRRYRKQIDSDGELFDELTSTIVRQVGDLRKMVDEFSSFARLPKPVFRPENAHDLVKQALFLQEVAHPEIDFRLDSAGESDIHIACDRHQLGQAMTNVLKNAVEAIEARARNAEPDYRGRIAVTMETTAEMLSIAVEDNGVGLPQDRERIVEPYVTTREKGTGLGLAIVNKIVEEHGGDMTFTGAAGGGTRVVLRFARDPLAAGAVAAE